MIFRPHFCFNVQIRDIFRQLHVTDTSCDQFTRLLTRFVISTGDDFQHPVGISSHNAKHSRSLDTLLTAGIRYNDPLDVFDHVSGTCDPDMIRHRSQLPVSFSCGICDGNRFRTTHGCHKFFFENCCVVL